MEFTTQDIKKLADLARLELTPEEQELFATQLASILEYAQQIQDVDTSGVTVTSHIDYDTQEFREDESQAPATVDAIVKQFPHRAGSLNQVKRILE